jgi:hypothetical protein
MNKKDFWSEIKKVLKKKDSRFWLMVFVIVSTSFLLVLWSINLKDYFSDKGNLSQDVENLKLGEGNTEDSNILGDFSSLLEAFAEEKEDSSLRDSQEDESLNKAQNIFQDLAEDKNNLATGSADSDHNEGEIDELRRKIEELEEKIED